MPRQLAKVSAGLLLFRRQAGELQVLLVHPGGPLWAKKDAGAWSIPKGEVEAGDDLLATAIREVEEELGELPAATGGYLPLGSIRQRGGKVVHAWAFEGDWEQGRQVRSNTFELQWPPRSGRVQEFPEIDRAELFGVTVARHKINQAQVELIDRLEKLLSS